MHLLLIRHGETEHNAQQLAMGRADIPLSERGRRQALALAAALGGGVPPMVPGAPTISAVYSSPLSRAATTAEPLAKALGVAVHTEPDLIEMDIGEMEGQTYGVVRERYPEFLRAWLSDALADAAMPGGGETLRQVQERAWGAVAAIRDRHPGETVAAVTHNFVIVTTLCRALALPLAQFRRLRHELAAVSVVELAPERETVLAVNDRCHLRDEGLSGRP